MAGLRRFQADAVMNGGRGWEPLSKFLEGDQVDDLRQCELCQGAMVMASGFVHTCDPCERELVEARDLEWKRQAALDRAESLETAARFLLKEAQKLREEVSRG